MKISNSTAASNNSEHRVYSWR